MITNMENNETNYTMEHHEEEEEEEEVDEAPSLSEFPLHNEEAQDHPMTSFSKNNSNRRSSSEPHEFFEFFSDVNGSGADMCSAEDIIFCGRLIPYGESHPDPMKFDLAGDYDKKQPAPAPAPAAFRRRSESLSELQSTSGGAASKARAIMRNSRSLDYQKLGRRASSYYSAATAAADVEKAPAGKRAELSSVSQKKAPRLRWSALLVFGIVKLPAEMELGDIKSRQARLSAVTLEAGGNFSVGRSSSGKGGGGGGGGASWRLLKALSCKDHASVAVTASLCVPQV